LVDTSIITDIFGDVSPIAPIVILFIGALLAPAVNFALKSRRALTGVTMAIIVISAIVNAILLVGDYQGTYAGLFTYDALAGLMILLFQCVAFLVAMVSGASKEVTRLHFGAYSSLLLAATSGMMFVATASDLITIFVGVELTSISSYALVAMKRSDPRASEAAVKYVIIGGLSTALTLYGMSMIYGVTGTTNLHEIALELANVQPDLFAIGIVMMIAGYGFKIAAVPFHMWAPDVYEGSATPVSAFLATGSKKMGIVVFLKIFIILFIPATMLSEGATESVQYIFAILATLTMTVGNVVAISQRNIKRMLAYSSIAQAGYILIALAVMSEYATAGALFHMFTHVFMKGGAFLVVGALICRGVGENISDYSGLLKRAPFLAFAMLIFLFSLAGIPPLAGFTSKFILFSGAINVDGEITQWVWLAFVAVINSAISLYYYARVVKAMFIDKGDSTERIKVPMAFTVAISICLILTVVLGVGWEWIFEYCEKAASTLF